MKRKEKVIINVFNITRAKECFKMVFLFCTFPICVFSSIICTLFSTTSMLPYIFCVYAFVSLVLFICSYLIMYFAEQKYKEVNNGRT